MAELVKLVETKQMQLLDYPYSTWFYENVHTSNSSTFRQIRNAVKVNPIMETADEDILPKLLKGGHVVVDPLFIAMNTVKKGRQKLNTKHKKGA